MAGSTNHPIPSQSTEKKRLHRSSTQVRGLVRIRSKVDKNTKKGPFTFTMFHNLFTSKSRKDEAKGRKMSVSKEGEKFEGSAANGPTNAEASEAPKITEGAITTFTTIEDVALKALKADGKSWKEIGKLFNGKKLEDVKARYKELKAATETSDATVDANDEEGEEAGTEVVGVGSEGKLGSSEKKGKSKVKDEGPGAERVITKAETSIKKGSSSREVPAMRVQMETGEKVILGDIVNTRDGEVLTAREVAHLLSFVPRYEKQMWLAIASRYFDKTAKRIDYLELMKVVKNAYIERCQASCCPPDKA